MRPTSSSKSSRTSTSTCVAWATTESDREPSSGDGCRPRPQLLLPQQGAPSFRDGRATGDPGGRRGGDPAEGPSGPAVRRLRPGSAQSPASASGDTLG